MGIIVVPEAESWVGVRISHLQSSLRGAWRVVSSQYMLAIVTPRAVPDGTLSLEERDS